jgi:hypothetical protein
LRLTQVLGCPSAIAANGDDTNAIGATVDASSGCFISLRTNGTTSREMSNKRHADSSGDLLIEVDAIVGVEEVVVRSLPPLLQRNELFAGVTLSGRAETVLLLDVRKVIELCGQDQDRSDAASTVRTSTGGAIANASDAPMNHRTSSRTSRVAQCILVVDDSVVVRRSLSKGLQAAGFVVREATNGRDALSVLNSNACYGCDHRSGYARNVGP